MRQAVFAYLDPGTGSLVLQLLAGGIAGAVAFARFRWDTVKRWFRSGDRGQT
jgi:hypothetical protein